MKVVEEKPVLIHKVIEILKDRYNTGEIDILQKKAYEHAKKIIKVDEKTANEMIEKLKEVNKKIGNKLRDIDIIKIVEIFPLSITELRAVLLQNRIDFKKEELEEILNVVKAYEKKRMGGK